jgi:integral membrane sensor domain MASE1
LHRVRALAQPLAISAIYLIVFIALDFASTAFQSQQGISIWYPPDGVSLALLLVLGARFIFLPVLGSLISSFLIYGFDKVDPLALIVWAVGLAILFALAAAAWRLRSKVHPLLTNQRDVLKFVLGAFLLATPPAFFSVLALQDSGQISTLSIETAMFSWWIGETIGFLVITPFILCVVMPLLNEKIKLSKLIQRVREEKFSIVVLAAYLGMMWIVFMSGLSLQFGLYYLLFLPLVLAALRYGLRGSIAMTLFVNGEQWSFS